VPFHSLVFCSMARWHEFAQHERLSQDNIMADLVGIGRRDLQTIVFAELCHRLSLKLSLGQRVAIADEMTAGQHAQLVSIASNQGASVIELTKETLAELLPAQPEAYLQSRWNGVTVIGDLHGNLPAMQQALQWAAARQHFVWLLGDVIDYGPDTLATADMAYRMVMSGEATLILGNHERKIARWLDQQEHSRHVRLNDGNRVTITALNRLKPLARKQWIGRFRALLGHAALLTQFGNITLLHAAAHPSLWEGTANPTLVEQFALYGEADHSTGKFRRVHQWVDAVPSGQMVFVGHDVVSQFPTIVTGAKGGQVVFLDTGCGIGGHLSTADLRFIDNGLRLECFNRH
jgi:Calcineurin-like phosphoesterase